MDIVVEVGFAVFVSDRRSVDYKDGYLASQGHRNVVSAIQRDRNEIARKNYENYS